MLRCCGSRFGFNAGSAPEASGSAALAMVNTWVATACATMSRMLAEWMLKGKPSMLGAASGAVAGLVAITPAAGFVGVVLRHRHRSAGGRRLPLGCQWPRRLLGADDLLDVRRSCGVGGNSGFGSARCRRLHRLFSTGQARIAVNSDAAE